MKRVLSFLLTVILVIGLVPVIGVFAVEEDDGQGSSVAAKPVSTAAEFAAMLPNGSYYLTTDLKIDASVASFSGTLDGKGHKITTTVPLFVEINATVSNLKIEGAVTGKDAGPLAEVVLGGKYTKITNNASVDASVDAGGLFGWAKVSPAPIEVTDFTNNGKIVGGKTAGGAIGNSAHGVFANFTNCMNTGDITGNGDSTGGIFGLIRSNKENVAKVSFENCTNSGVINAVVDTPGGIAGFGQSWAEINFKNCHNTGDVKRTADGGEYSAGGILGHSSGVTTFENCSNSGTITNIKFHSGGIVGQISDSGTFTNCVNTGNVSSEVSHAGGIAAVVSWDVEMTNCTNSGNVSGKKMAGGLLANGGSGDTQKNFTFTYCGNSGNISAETDTVGALAAYLACSNGAPEFFGCYNTGNVTGGLEVGTFVGYFNGAASVNAKFTACFNTGKITATNADYKSAAVFHCNYDTPVPATSIVNVYCTPGVADALYRNKTEGYANFTSNITAEAVASGELCHLLNTAVGKEVFFQTLGKDGAPVMDNTHKSVVKDGETFKNPAPVKPAPMGDSTTLYVAVAVVSAVATLSLGVSVCKKNRANG